MPTYALEIDIFGNYVTDMPGFEIWVDGALLSSHSAGLLGTSILTSFTTAGTVPASLEFRFTDASGEVGRSIEVRSVKINNKYANVGNYLSDDNLTFGQTSTLDVAIADPLFDESEPAASEFTTGATRTFTTGNDTRRYHKSTADEVFDALAGRDVIYTGTGNDKIAGNAGDDLIRSGDGNDLVSAGADNDRVYAGDGNDTIYGGTGNDRLHGEGGNDMIYGNDGVDFLNGHAGTDTLLGGDGNDRLNGGADDDILFGGADNDTLVGGSGNDTLDGGDGDDLIYGGSGVDVANGGDDSDTISGGDDGDTLSGDDGSDVIYGDAGDDTIHGGNDNDYLHGGDDDDTITGGANDDILIGAAGADTMDGGANEDILHGHGLNANTAYAITKANAGVVYNAETNSFYQYVGSAVSWAAANAAATGATLNGITGHLVNITSQAENDFVETLGTSYWLGATDQSIEGQWIWENGAEAGLNFWNGDTTGAVVGGSYESWDPAQPNDNAGAGADFGRARGVDDTWSDDDASATSNYIIEWDAGLMADDNAIDILSGGAQGDYIYGYGGADILNGDAGNDIIFGGTGDDTIDGGENSDNLYGQDGNDTITGGQGADYISGGIGNDIIDAGDNIDIVYGDDGNDTIDGGQGADILTGGAGLDTINGGLGDDFIYGDNTRDITIINGSFEDNVLADNTFIEPNPTGWTGTGGAWNPPTTQFTDHYVPDGVNTGYEYAGNTLTQTLSATLAANTIYTLNAFIGDAVGGDSPDYEVRLLAGATTIGSSSSATPLTGGWDALTFSVDSAAFAADVGQTLSLEIEVFAGTGWRDFDDFRLTANSSDNNEVDTLNGDEGDDTIYGNAGNDVLSGGDDNDIIFGGDDDDTINGDDGDDRLLGEDGDDIINGGDGNDQIYGDVGDDTIDDGAGDDVVYADQLTAVIGQAGQVTTNQTGSGQWHTVTFEAMIDNPIIKMTTNTENDAAPVTLRVRNVTDSGFEWQIDEWDYLDGVHGSETVSWLAIAEGTHTLDNGTVIQAGTVSASQTSSTGPNTTVTFHSAFGTAPVIMSQVMTTNEAAAVTVHNENRSITGFRLHLEEEEGSGLNHAAETVGWIAIDNGGSVANGLLVGETGNNVTHATSTVNFGANFADNTPVVLLDIQTEDGGDTAVARGNALTASSVSFSVEEEQSANAETNHTTEVIGYYATTAGLIYANGDNGTDTITSGAGADVLYGGDGLDTFIFESGTAFTGIDSIIDFRYNQGDVLDISDIITGVFSGTITDYVQFVDSGNDLTVQIDANGTTGGASFSSIATLEGNAGLDEALLYTNGNIVV